MFGVYRDRIAGAILLGTIVPLYIYYTIWVLISPFIDRDHPIQSYFPDRWYALMIPTVLGIFFLTILSTFISLVLIKSRQQSYQKTI